MPEILYIVIFIVKNVIQRLHYQEKKVDKEILIILRIFIVQSVKRLQSIMKFVLRTLKFNLSKEERKSIIL